MSPSLLDITSVFDTIIRPPHQRARELHIVTQSMSSLGDEKSDWSYLLPAAFSDDKIMLEFLSRMVADEVEGSNRTCQWPMWQLNTSVFAVTDVKLIGGQSEDGVSVEEKSCVDENGKSIMRVTFFIPAIFELRTTPYVILQSAVCSHRSSLCLTEYRDATITTETPRSRW
ncbi:hypothetical protein NL676_025569 [Syzygium grande]|nr:hypothetical protein NL676_025569 [Syzygium grande]